MARAPEPLHSWLVILRQIVIAAEETKEWLLRYDAPPSIRVNVSYGEPRPIEQPAVKTEDGGDENADRRRR